MDCWGLNEDLPPGNSEVEQKWDSKKLSKAARELHTKHDANLAGDYMGLTIISWEVTLNKNLANASTEYKRNATYNPLLVLCAMANTSNYGWECSGEFTFEERT